MNLDSHADPEADHDRVFEDTDSSSASSVHEEPVIQHVADPARLGVAAAAGAVQKFFQSRGGLQFGSSHVFYSETGGPYVVNPSTHTAVEQQQQQQPPQYSTSDMLSMMQLPPPPPGPPLLSVERGAVHSGAAGTASVDLLNVFEVPVAKKKGSRSARRSTKKHVPRTDSKKTLKEGRGQEVVDVNEELFIPHSPPFSPDAAVIQGGSDDAIPNEPPSDDHSEYELHMGEAEVAEGGAVGEEIAQKEALGALVNRLADGSIPPLRAHLYYEEEHGAFNDHIAHAALEKKLAEEAAVRAWLDQDREKEARRWARYQRALMSYGSSTQGGMRGEPRWSSIEDAATYRASMQHATLYMQHLSHYLAAFAAGAALLTLIATTLPPYEASQSGLGLVVGGGGDDCVDSSGSSNNARAHKDDDNTLRVDSIAVVVLVLRRFDAPLFLFLSIMLLLTTLVTFPWGLAESKWRDKKRSVAQLMQAEGGGGAAAGKRSGAGSATAYMAQRRAQFGDEYAQRQRLRNGDTSMVDISTTAGASGSGTSTAVSPASAAAATAVDEYGVNPRVAMQLNEYVYQKQQQQHQQQYGGGMDSALATMRPTLFSTMGYRGEASSPTLFSDGPLGFSQSMLNTSDSRAGMWQQPQQRGSGGHTPEVGNSMTAMNTTGGYNMNTSASAFWASRRMNRASMNRASMSHGSMNSKGLGGIPSDHQQFDDTFYVVPEDGSSNIIPTNPISRSFRMARLWLARKVLGSYYVEQVDVLMQPRLWCILVCFAVTVAELALLQDRTTLDLLRSLSPDTVTTADGTASSGSGAYRNTLLATYIIRATMLLLVWVLDMFL